MPRSNDNKSLSIYEGFFLLVFKVSQSKPDIQSQSWCLQGSSSASVAVSHTHTLTHILYFKFVFSGLCSRRCKFSPRNGFFLSSQPRS